MDYIWVRCGTTCLKRRSESRGFSLIESRECLTVSPFQGWPGFGGFLLLSLSLGLGCVCVVCLPFWLVIPL